ncbi:MAG: tol-pal system-associated acyl-CoA thioesterase [Gammaproteobacteria bacterium]|nr:MAG: tol-pal system-associated acyl-CoA thioesterase [Gammaproteobacteria bacterium]
MSTGFEWPVRVYFEDTDTAGVVYYANYLKFMERARTEWLRSLGFEQDVLMEQYGIVFAVRRAAVDYLAPARFNDRLVVDCRIERAGRASIEFEQRVRRAGEEAPLVTGRIKLACIDMHGLRPAPIPEPIQEAIQSVL